MKDKNKLLLPQPGTDEWHVMLRSIEHMLDRDLKKHEVDALRVKCSKHYPKRGEGASRVRHLNLYDVGALPKGASLLQAKAFTAMTASESRRYTNEGKVRSYKTFSGK